jgi:hypothetical protein
MAKYAHADVLDNGIAYIKANCNKMILINGFSSSYATVNGANKVAEVAMATGDFTLAGADGAARVMTVAAKSNVTSSASATGTPDLHVAFVDTVTSKVLYVTDETTNQPVTAPNPINFPSLTYTCGQPT